MIIIFWQLDQFLSNFEYSKTLRKISKNLCWTCKIHRHIAQNAGHTIQNDGRAMHNVSRNTLNVCQGPKGGLEVPPRAPVAPLPLYLKKLMGLEMIFRTLGKKKNKKNKK